MIGILDWFHGSSSLAQAAPAGNQWTPLIGVALLAGVVFMISARGRRRGREADTSLTEYARRQMDRAKREHVAREDLGQVLSEIERWARQMNAQLDNRFTKLQRVVADADARIQTLRSLLPENTAVEPIEPIEPNQPIEPSEPNQPIEPDQTSLRSTSSSTHWRGRVGPMLQQGLSAEDIADRLQKQLGEVQLEISMYHRSSPNARTRAPVASS